MKHQFIKIKYDSRDIFRSLLQKSFRRGCTSLVEKSLLYMADKNESHWLRARAGVIVFEECWTSAALIHEFKFDPVKVLITQSSMVKRKDAAGLGTLAYNLTQGDLGTLSFAPNQRSVRIVAAGLERPIDFFRWAKRNVNGDRLSLVQAAEYYFPMASWPWDKAFIIAGAYLAVSDHSLKPQLSVPSRQDEFPYWVAIDKHTAEGKKVLQRVSEKFSIPFIHLSWASFYCESAKANAVADSDWWDAEVLWRTHKIGLSVEQMQNLWSKVSQEVEAHVASLARKVSENINNHNILWP